LDLERQVIFEALFNFLAKQDLYPEVKELFYQVACGNEEYESPPTLRHQDHDLKVVRLRNI